MREQGDFFVFGFAFGFDFGCGFGNNCMLRSAANFAFLLLLLFCTSN